MAMIQYPKTGEHKEALEDILNILGNPDWQMCDDPGCDFERKESIYTARAALGMPVPRHRCKHCGALDQIFAERTNPPEDRESPSIMSPQYCHACGKAEEGKPEWIEAPVED